MLSMAFGFLLGAVLGSFIKVLADRSLDKRTFWGRSYCTECKKILRWYDLFPILSYLFLQGKCRYCQTKLNPEYWLIETLTGLLVAFLFWQSFQNFPGALNIFSLILFIWELAFKVFILIVVLTVALTDLKQTIIPDRITYPAVAIALTSLIAITIYKVGILYWTLLHASLEILRPDRSDYFLRHAYVLAQPIVGSLIGATLLGIFFLSLILITKGRGMGGGDLKLGIFLGLVFGFPQSILVLVLSFLTGSVVAVGLIILKQKNFGQTIAFGPYLSLSAIIVLFYAQPLLQFLRWV